MDKFEPNWSKAPEWANYFAIDDDGEMFWYEELPLLDETIWTHSDLSGGEVQFAGYCEESFDYTVLHKRPNTLFKDWKESLAEALGIREGIRETVVARLGSPSHVAYLKSQGWDTISVPEDTPQPSAASILKAGLGHMEDRAKTYDADGGERSMAKTVEAFNALTRRDLTETEGWLMMVCLKLARANQGGFRMDSFEDGAAYMALMGECAAYMESKES